MANRYWVGGTGNWSSSNTANWSTTSGGAGGASVPISTDNAIFDANSGTGTVTFVYAPSVTDFTCTGTTLTFAGTNNISINGNVTLGAGATYNETGNIYIFGNCTYTSNGAKWAGSITFIPSTALTLTLGDALLLNGNKTLTLAKGTITTNNKNMTLGQFVSNSTNACTLNLGSSTINFIPSATATATFFYVTNQNLVLNAGTSTVKVVPSTITSCGMNLDNIIGGWNFYNFWYSPTYNCSLDVSGTGGGGANFNDFKDDGTAAHTITWHSGQTYDFLSGFHVSGTAGQLISLRSSTSGSQSKLDSFFGTANCNYLNIKDSMVEFATWNAGGGSIDSGNNTNWNFAAASASITPNRYNNAQTFYTPVVTRFGVTQHITATRYNNTNTFYTAVVRGRWAIRPSRVTNSNTFYPITTVVQIRGSVKPSLYTNTQTFYTHVVTRGAVNIGPALYTNSSVFYAEIVNSTIKVTPVVYTNTQTFYVPVVTVGLAGITPSLFVNTQTFYTPVLSGGIPAGHITPALYTNTNTFYAVVVIPHYRVSLPVFDNVNTIYTPVITTSTKDISPALVDNTNTFFSVSVTVGSLGIHPSLVTNSQQFFAPVVGYTTQETSQSFIIGL